MSQMSGASSATSERRRWHFLLAVFLISIGFYSLFGWEAGSDAIDTDTTSLLVAWKMLRQGQTLEHWTLATPKFLPVVLDGTLFEIGGFQAVLVRSVLSSTLIVVGGAAFVYSIAGPWGAVLAVGFVLLNGQMLIQTMAGNSSILGTGFVAAAMLMFQAKDTPGKRLAGIGLLFAAALARSELLVFLPIAALAFAWHGWARRSRPHLLAAGAGVLLIGLAVTLDTVVPTRLTGEWANSRDISLLLADDAAQRNAAGERLNVEPDYWLRHTQRLEDSYATNLSVLLPRLLRPLPLFLFTGLAGLACLWGRNPRAAILLVVMGGVPLILGWLIYVNGGGLYERFFLLSMLSCLLAAAFGYQAAWDWLGDRPSFRWAWAGRIAIAMIAFVAMAVGLRDAYNQRRGYLRSVSSDLRVFREGIEPLLGADLREKRLLLNGWQWGYTNLVLDTDPNKVIRDDDLASMESPERYLCACDYYFYRRGSALTDASLGIAAGPVTLPCMEKYWQSADDSYQFFRRDRDPAAVQ